MVLSSNSRAIPLPQPIAAFYHASDVRDKELLTDCFTDEAIVHDEGKEYFGSAAISEHIIQVNTEAKVSTDITNCEEKNDQIIVTAMLSGEFKGSPLPLDFHFTLDGRKIKKLNII
ncbi:nuclear transport factor 2 family protein [Paenibacillus paeoniae]|uniref:Nuclear transport factor 2 family protein n=1 Tax=Paenibacillus paeoniae TaxID=2292705 RepID=A0A371PNT0_9BACL|nr:nuclear transport factor 2 family protein [Paenibacillus paeoniae]